MYLKHILHLDFARECQVYQGAPRTRIGLGKRVWAKMCFCSHDITWTLICNILKKTIYRIYRKKNYFDFSATACSVEIFRILTRCLQRLSCKFPEAICSPERVQTWAARPWPVLIPVRSNAPAYPDQTTDCCSLLRKIMCFLLNADICSTRYM